VLLLVLQGAPSQWAITGGPPPSCRQVAPCTDPGKPQQLTVSPAAVCSVCWTATPACTGLECSSQLQACGSDGAAQSGLLASQRKNQPWSSC